MKAVGFWQPGESTSVIEDLSLPHPSMPKGRDLLIRVRAVAVNPRDLKSRRNISPSAGNPVVMGYDASGVVEATGPDVTLFRPGDHVFYAGVLDRQGANAEFQLVDERITGIKPAALSFEAAASVPLTGLTAWEMLFDRLQLSVNGDAWRCGRSPLYGYTACPHSESGEHHRDCLPAGECQSGSRVWCALCPGSFMCACATGCQPCWTPSHYPDFLNVHHAICLGKYGRNYCPTRPYRTHRRP